MLAAQRAAYLGSRALFLLENIDLKLQGVVLGLLVVLEVLEVLVVLGVLGLVVQVVLVAVAPLRRHFSGRKHGDRNFSSSGAVTFFPAPFFSKQNFIMNFSGKTVFLKSSFFQ